MATIPDPCPCEGSGVLVSRRCSEGECRHPAGHCPWQPCLCPCSAVAGFNYDQIMRYGRAYLPPGYAVVKPEEHCYWIQLTKDRRDYTAEGGFCWDRWAVRSWAWQRYWRSKEEAEK